ncbi:MAG: phosphotransferase, partial [Nocardia sp.]|nr:phosphotransferase [Nocardia sp.]
QPVAEALFAELDRMHALHSGDWNDSAHGRTLPTTRVEWEQRLAREVTRIRLEYDTQAPATRLHGDLGLPGLHEVFQVRPASGDDIRLGAVHGDPTFGNILQQGRNGEQIALLDLELTQPGSPVWDYVAFATRNPWPDAAVRAEVEDWCRLRLRRYYGEHAVSDFDRYLVLEAWKSVAGDSFRLPLRVAADPAFLDGDSAVLEDAAQALHRNLTRVFDATGQLEPTLAEVRAHIARWALRLVQQREQQQPRHRAPGGPAAGTGNGDDTSQLPQLSIRPLLAAGSGELQAAVAVLKSSDGPARLEPVAAQFDPPGPTETDLVSRIRMRTVLMSESYEYGDVSVVFELDRSGRITARPDSTADLALLTEEYGGPYVLGPIEDLARRLGADTLSLEVSGKEGVQAAQSGFGWDPEKWNATAASLTATIRSQAPDGWATDPADSLPAIPREMNRRFGPGVLRATRWWASKNLTDPDVAATSIEFHTPTGRPRNENFLPTATDTVADGEIAPEKAVQLAVTTAMEPAHARGHYTHVWCVTDRDGKVWKVRLIAAEPGDKDLAANPTHPKLLGGDRAFHWIDLTEDRAEDLARDAGVNVPETVAAWGSGSASRGASSIRRMGAGKIPTTADEDRWETLKGLLRQLRKLQKVELPDDLAARTVAEQEQLYRSMQRIKYEQRHGFLDALGIPMPHEISIPGDTTWDAVLSHGNATFRNLWVRADGEVALDNWNLTGIRHQLWDYVTIFWSPWADRDLNRVTTMVENEIRERFGEPGVGEFRRLRAMACLDSLYSDSNSFVQKIRIDPRQAATLTRRFYSDSLALWHYADAVGSWPGRGARPLGFGTVRD